eukprot:TRINITY_DN296_c0_g1_i1.p1 TRINITY_DN296_c0_g1~~TRINITY_DN296_c0_g1_i1.p1  ORF type:complete len:387 (+),score=72.46 TRINITY_DN296_c0_g1_i1:118-1161(+)
MGEVSELKKAKSAADSGKKGNADAAKNPATAAAFGGFDAQTSDPASLLSDQPGLALPTSLGNADLLEARARAAPSKRRGNPGKFEDMDVEAKNIMTDSFDGFKLDYSRQLSENFGVSHSIKMGSTTEPAGYSFMANYADNDKMIMGRIDTGGAIMGRLHASLTKKLSTSIVAQTFEEQVMVSADADYRGSDCTATFKAVNMDQFSASYMQSVTNSLALGVDGFYQHSQALSALQYGFRYQRPKWVLSGMLSSMGQASVSYSRSVSNKVKVATGLIVALVNGSVQSHWSMGYEYRLSYNTFKASIDGSGKVSAVLEEKFNPMMGYSLSGELDHFKEEYRFGIGFSLNL